MPKLLIDCGAYNGGDADRLGIEADHIVYFEPNTDLDIELTNNSTIERCAVWTDDGFHDFYIGEDANGSTLLKEKQTGKLDYEHPRKVRTIDLGKYIKRQSESFDYIIVKMDIEGAEYPVLEKMIKDGTIKLVDELWVEFHGEKVGRTGYKTNKFIIELGEYTKVIHLMGL